MLNLTPKRPQSFISTRKWLFITLLVLVLVIQLLGLNSAWIEQGYSTHFYVGVSKTLRAITGWVPFSVGDLLYAALTVYLITSIFRAFRNIRRKKRRFISSFPFMRYLVIILSIYVIFNVLWGINYDRQGIAKQIGLDVKPYTLKDLKDIQEQLLLKTNESKLSLANMTKYPDKEGLFRRAKACYNVASMSYPFLSYHPPALKSSLFGEIGDYLGFSGYYNPFTGEAQVNTTTPKMLIPYTTCHEIGHQMGYAKENEANFVGYLTATGSSDTLFRYSAYLDLFVYATREVAVYDSNFAKHSFASLIPPVKQDLKEIREFWVRHENPIEPFITWLYGKYLKANKQPRGMQSYNEVTADLIAYYKKFGKI